jgi:hypothetical protein
MGCIPTGIRNDLILRPIDDLHLLDVSCGCALTFIHFVWSVCSSCKL